MPVDRSRYPREWPAISRRIRERSGGRCECTGECGMIHARPFAADGRCTEQNGQAARSFRGRVVLTVAHLKHAQSEMDCRDEVLAAFCQRCHLRYDAPLHRLHAAETRRRRMIARGQLELIGTGNVAAPRKGAA